MCLCQIAWQNLSGRLQGFDPAPSHALRVVRAKRSKGHRSAVINGSELVRTPGVPVLRAPSSDGDIPGVIGGSGWMAPGVTPPRSGIGFASAYASAPNQPARSATTQAAIQRFMRPSPRGIDLCITVNADDRPQALLKAFAAARTAVHAAGGSTRTWEGWLQKQLDSDEYRSSVVLSSSSHRYPA